MYTFLILLNGSRAGVGFFLREDVECRIGRGLDCHVVLDDPLSSRVHAIVGYRDGAWWVQDAGSRNGTCLDGEPIKEARLADGCQLTIGSIELLFRQSEERPADVACLDAHVAQTIVREMPIQSSKVAEHDVEILTEPARARDFLLLHQLSVELLGVADPDEVIRIGLHVLQDRTSASVVGFLWVSDEGDLKPKLVIPATAPRNVRLSKTLTELVCRQRHAVWIDNQSASHNTGTLDHFADAICVPLADKQATLGAIHLYLEEGRFEQSDFDVAVSVANMLVVALVRARQQAMLAARHDRLVAKTADVDELHGESEPMRDLRAKIHRVARATGCVLIRGESGSGKELVARAVHRVSTRADRPLLSVNCAAIPPDLMESQLFGHKRGAFTGAEADHLGWFQQADSGTLFLDEVGELTLEGQAKLLRILEGHPFLPVGATEQVQVDVRVIAATNRDLSDFVREKRFREDLFYRLSVFELCVPPLRDRGADIEWLVDFFLDHFRMQHGRPNLTLSSTARARLLSYGWPGNVRQLRNVMDSAVVMAEGDVIEAGDLGLRDFSAGDELETLRIDHWERKLIREAIRRTRNRVPEAAKLLGIGRATLYRKIEEYGIQR